jgi:hypothetical protein
VDKDLVIEPAPGNRPRPLGVSPIGSFTFQNIPSTRTIKMRYLSISRTATGTPLVVVASQSKFELEHSSCIGHDSIDSIFSVQSASLVLQNLTISDSRCSLGCIEVSGAASTLSVVDSTFESLSSGSVVRSSQGASINLTRVTCRVFPVGVYSVFATSGRVNVVDSSFSSSPGSAIYAYGQDGAFPLDVSVTRSRFFAFNDPSGLPVLIISVDNARTVAVSGCTFSVSWARALVLTNISSSISITESSFVSVKAKVVGKSTIGITGCYGTVLVHSCTFDSAGFSDSLGGAISVEPASGASALSGCPNLSVALRNSTFEYCNSMFGTGLYVQGVASLLVDGCSFANNLAALQGAAVRAVGFGSCFSNISIVDSRFANLSLAQVPPTRPPQGGPQLTKRATITETPNTRDILVGEVAGAALSLDGPFASIDISRNLFENNEAFCYSGWADGGAVRIKVSSNSGKITMNDNVFRNNSAIGDDEVRKVSTATGGALSITGDVIRLEMVRNTFIYNQVITLNSSWVGRTSTAVGGAIFIQASSVLPASSSSVILRDSNFERNEARVGGALALQQVAAQLTNVSFRSNKARLLAGAMVILRSKLVEKFDVEDVSLSSVTFAASEVELPTGDIRSLSCLPDPGIVAQESFRIRCEACSISGSTSDSPYGNHLSVLSGAPFLLNGQSARDVPIVPIYDSTSGTTGGSDPDGVVSADSLSLNSGYALITDRFDGILLNLFSTYAFEPATCEDIFSSETLQLPGLSSDYQCRWVSLSQVLLTASTLPWPASLVVIPLNSTSVAPLLSAGPYPVRAPISPVLPQVEISAPGTVAACENLLLTAQFSRVGVFPFQARWSVLSAVGAPNVASFIVANSAEPMLFIADSLWGISSSVRSLTISYTVASVFVSVTKNVTILRMADPSPKIFVEGPARRRHYASVELQINGRVEVPTCLSSRNLSLTRQWSLVSGPALNRPISFTQGLALFLPAGAMVPGNDYIFEFGASVPEVPGLSITQRFTVSALFTPMMAYSSGDGGLLSQSSNLSFEVTVVDPDRSTSNTLYLWDIACGTAGSSVFQSAASPTEPNLGSGEYLMLGDLPVQFPFASYRCEDLTCLVLPLGRSRVQQVQSVGLPVRNYTMFAYSARDERSLITSFRIDLRAIAPTVPVRLIPQWTSPKPLHYERLAVSATVNGLTKLNAAQYTVQWAVLQNGTNILVSSAVTTPLDAKTLYIAFRPNSFSAGILYTLELTVFDKSNGAILGRNWLDMQMNDAPMGGSIAVSPTVLTQFETVSISANGWMDEDDPVRYSYSLVIDDQTGDEILLSDLVDVKSSSVTISLAGDFILRARIMDLMGSASVVDTPIRVSPASTQTSQSDKLSFLQGALNICDLRRASGYIVLLLREANVALSPDLNLRRTIATALTNYLSQAPLTSANSIFVLRACSLLTYVPAGIDSIVRDAVVDLVIKAVDFAFENPSFGSSSSRLFSTRSDEGQRSLSTFASSLSAAMSVLKNQTLDDARMISLQRSVEKVPLIMSRFALTDEETVIASSLYINMMSFVSCGSEAFNITLASGIVRFSPTEVVPCDQRGVQFGVTVWNGTFPTSPRVNVSGTVVVVPTTVISISISPSAPQTVQYNITTIFTETQPPTGINASVTACAQFDGFNWNQNACSIQISGGAQGTVLCQCAQPVTAVTSSTPSQTTAGKVSLALVFGNFPLVTITDVPRPGSPPSAPGAPTESGGFENASVGGLSILAIAVIASVAGVVVIAAAIGLSVFLYRRHGMRTASMKVRTLLKRSTGS